jgi:Pyruvate/2-oxoacid:ferredoxin oxidoreductase delta subunit
MDDDSLGIDTSLCDGCGLCASVCPQGAIVSQRISSALERAGRSTALFVCDMAGIDGEQATATIPCLHALGLQELLHLYRRGTRHLSVASGDCAACFRAKAVQLWDLVEQLNRLLVERKLDTLSVRVLPAAQWQQCLKETQRGLTEPALSRRDFFHRAAKSSIGIAMDIAGPEEEKPFLAPGRQLPRARLSDIVPFVPRIDPQTCSGCNACVRLCPQGALSLQTGDDGLHYRLDAEFCTGCAMCSDVCNQGAVNVAHWEPQIQLALPLKAQRCRACGAPFHSPAGQKSAHGLCFVCRETNHARALYQVMESAQ